MIFSGSVESRASTGFTHGFESLVDRPCVERLPCRDGGELEDDDPPRFPVAFMYFVRAPSGQVACTRGIERRFDAFHEFLIPRHVANLYIENDIRAHLLFLDPLYSIMRSARFSSEAG